MTRKGLDYGDIFDSSYGIIHDVAFSYPCKLNFKSLKARPGLDSYCLRIAILVLISSTDSQRTHHERPSIESMSYLEIQT